MNFRVKLPKWEIHDEQGNLVNARELVDKSITTEAMADEFLSTPHHVSAYMKALSNKMLLTQFMKRMNSLAISCIEKARVDKLWDITYNTGIVYFLDNFISRYSEMFETYDVDEGYFGQEGIKDLYREAIKAEIHVSVNGKELAKVEDIKYFSKNADIRANSAGFKALIPHYTEEQFLDVLKKYIDNCYSSRQDNFWFLVDELHRRTEQGNW